MGKIEDLEDQVNVLDIIREEQEMKLVKVSRDKNIAETQYRYALGKLADIQAQLSTYVKTIKEFRRMKYTGWYVCLKKDNDKWECMKVLHRDADEDEWPEEFDVIMPIPEPSCLPEFDGL